MKGAGTRECLPEARNSQGQADEDVRAGGRHAGHVAYIPMSVHPCFDEALLEAKACRQISRFGSGAWCVAGDYQVGRRR
jgi:hypothetical protein